MGRFRPILAWILAAISVCIIGCGGSQVAQPTTYSADQMAQIGIYAPRVIELRERFPELEEYIQDKDWGDISSFIHGPMGELRARLDRVAVRLLPQSTPQARELAEEIGNHLERLDAASESYNQIEAANQYRQALDDFDAFISLIPKAED